MAEPHQVAVCQNPTRELAALIIQGRRKVSIMAGDYLSPKPLDWALARVYSGRTRYAIKSGIRSRKASSNKRAKRAGITARLYSVELLRLFNAARWRCIYCGRADFMTVDHVHPLREGGGNSIANVVPCCDRCNQAKGGQPLVAWLDRIGLDHDVFQHRRRCLFRRWLWFMFSDSGDAM